MIIRPYTQFSLLYIMQGSFFDRLWKPILALFLFSSIVAYYQSHLFQYQIPLNAGVFTLLGIALAIFHGFCNNAAYDRFWEGRKQWGALLWQNRTLANKLMALNLPETQRRDLMQLSIAFAHALRHQLRQSSPHKDLQRTAPPAYLTEIMAAPLATLAITHIMCRLNADLLRNGHIDSIQWQTLEKNLDEMTLIQSSCERISNTPIPFAYFVLLHRTVYWYCFMLPFGLVNSIGWVTPIMVTFVGYTFMALNHIIDEISEPFGTAENDLALHQISLNIEKQVSQIGRFSLPEAVTAAQTEAYVVQ